MNPKQSSESDRLQDSLTTLDLTDHTDTTRCTDTRGESWQTLETLCDEDLGGSRPYDSTKDSLLRKARRAFSQKENKKRSKRWPEKKNLVSLISSASKRNQGKQKSLEKDEMRTKTVASQPHHAPNQRISDGERFALEFLLGGKVEMREDDKGLSEGERYAYKFLLGELGKDEFGPEADAPKKEKTAKRWARQSNSFPFNSNMTKSKRFFALEFLLGVSSEPPREHDCQTELTPGEECTYALLLEQNMPRNASERKMSRRRSSFTAPKKLI